MPTANETKPSQYRLGPDTIAALDRLAAKLSKEQGRKASRADAIRYAAIACDPKAKR